MESKEMLTLPRIVPMQRTIATPLSPIPSRIESSVKEGLKSVLSSSTELVHGCSCKSIQVTINDDHIQRTSSTIDVSKQSYKNKVKKRSRSEEKLGNIKTSPDSISSFLRDLNQNPDVNELFSKYPLTKKKRICQNCKQLFDNFDIVRRSVSNNTYFREDTNFNANQQRTSKHFIEMSKHYYINGPDRVSKENNHRMKQQFSVQSDFLSHIDTRDNNRVIDSNKFTKTSNESHSDQYEYDDPDLMFKLVDKYHENVLSKNDKDFGQVFGNDNKSHKILAMTQGELKNLINLDILAFAEKFRINITPEALYDLSEELFSLFLMDFNSNSFINEVDVTEQIKKILENRGLSELQIIYLTNILTDHCEEEFVSSNCLKLNSSNFQSDSLVILPNIIQGSSEYKRNESKENDDRDFSIKGISQKDIDTNVEVYVNQISHEINNWIFNLLIPETRDDEIRQAIVNDLVTDIVDRHKYLELHPSTETSEISEMEHLKYQIFKLIYKFELHDMTLVDNAIDLMKIIQSIPVPIFCIQEGQERKLNAIKIFNSEVVPGQFTNTAKISEAYNLEASSSKYVSSDNVCCKRPTCKRKLNEKATSDSFSGKSIVLEEPKRSYQTSASTRRLSSTNEVGSTNIDYDEMKETPELEASEVNLASKQYKSYPNNKNSHFSGGIKIKDDENYTNTETNQLDATETDNAYKRFLKEWVEEIPLPMTNTEDQAVSKRARTDIYKEILDVVSKLRSERDTINNRFLFEDKLDDEIEKMLSKLPQSAELTSKKHILKVKLIKQTYNVGPKSSSKTYKQQLLESLKSNLPKPTIDETEDPVILEIYEQLQILNLVEDFIIYSHYQNQDPIAAEAYRKKLIKHTEDFVQELKTNHGKALKNIDAKLYIDDILNMLKNVPLPSNETVHEEANEIFLSVEIDNWLSNLPLVQNNDFVEQLHIRRLRNNLAKKILNIEKDFEYPDSELNNSLKYEISQFLGKTPLREGESLNINNMVDELIQRLKTRPRINGNDSKRVAFHEPDYEEFSKNMPLCSTYTEQPGNHIETQIKRIPSIKSIHAIDPSQHSHRGRYHNISKPLFDDIRINQTCCDEPSLEEIPNYETFDGTHPQSSNTKYDTHPHWYTLQETRQEPRQSKNLPENNGNETEQRNKSVQTINPDKQSQSRHYHNIAQPLLNDLRHDSSDNVVNNDSFSAPPRNAGSDQNWYTLHESKQNNFQFPDDRYVPYPANTSQKVNNHERLNRAGNHNMPERDYNLPHHDDANYYEVQQRNNNEPSILNDNEPEDAVRRFNNTVQQRWSHSHSPEGNRPRRRDSVKLNQTAPGFNQDASPHRASYLPRSPKDPVRNTINRPAGSQNTIDDQRNSSPRLHRSDLFYKSTDPNGIRRVIDRNKSVEVDLDISSPSEHMPGYYQPSVIIPPCYLPLRFRSKKNYMPVRNPDERYREDSDEENYEGGEDPCRCVKMWSKGRIRYCPFEQYEGFPMCVTSPYYGPYFY